MNEDKNKNNRLKKFMEDNSNFPFETVFGGMASADYGTLNIFGWYIYNKKRENNDRLPFSITPADFIQKLEDDTYGLKSKFGEGAINKAINDFERLIGEHRITRDPKNVPEQNFLYQFAKSLDEEGVLRDVTRGTITENYRKALEETAPLREKTREGEVSKPLAEREARKEEQVARGEPSKIERDPISLGFGTIKGEEESELEAEFKEEIRKPESADEDEDKEREKETETETEIRIPRKERLEVKEGEAEKDEGDLYAETEKEKKQTGKTGADVGAEEAQIQRLVIPKTIGGVPTRMVGEPPKIRRVKEGSEEGEAETEEETEEEAEMKARQEQMEQQTEQQMEQQDAARAAEYKRAATEGAGRGRKKESPPVIKFLKGAGWCTAGGAICIGALMGSAGAKTISEVATADKGPELIKIIFEILL